MQSVGGAYAELESYQDKGYVETTFKPGTDAERVTKLTFETNFMRPNLFRFDWKDRLLEDSEERHHIIWCDGKAAYWKYPDQESDELKCHLNFRIQHEISDSSLLLQQESPVVSLKLYLHF